MSSPPSGVLILSGFDPTIVQAIFNPIDRTLDLTALHTGATTITATDSFGLTATLAVTVQAYAGKAYDTTQVTITGDPASANYVAESAADAALLVAYPEPGAHVDAQAANVRGNVLLPADDAVTVTVPLTISGPGYATYQKDVSVLVQNLAQPGIPPKNLLVSDFPETIVENGTLFYADVSFDEPARLLYYHYANPAAEPRRVIVKAQNNGIDSSELAMLSGIAGPNANILSVGHESTKRFLVNEATNQGRVFEVPPHATVNIVDQLLPAGTLVSGLMQLRVISGSSIRVAVVVQDASDIPVGPISDTLLSSAVKHARGVYSVPDFSYDLSYSIGDDPVMLLIGKLPLPNLVSGEVLGGDYGVKQSATVTLLNPTASDARVGMWFEPRGGRATGTFLINGELVQLHPVEFGQPALVRGFTVPAHGYARIDLVTMPEGGSSYPVQVLFASQPPPGATWNVSAAVY
ncbi:MAG TPA: hypothetical protein VEJ41_04815 [Candidatus Acidoferrales bacterium]|nr:hypothetical protein [Candidatus Acidoferrales bacterium]